MAKVRARSMRNRNQTANQLQDNKLAEDTLRKTELNERVPFREADQRATR